MESSDMPQHLCFTVDGESVAVLTTGNLSGQGQPTTYAVSWISSEANNVHVGNFDTGIPSQPTSNTERQQNFLCDLTHARRGIAAARAAADDILNQWSHSFRHVRDNFEEIKIYLRTNFYDRGSITVTQQDGQTSLVRLQIGCGPVRPIGANPHIPLNIDFQTAASRQELSPLGKALKLFTPKDCRLLELVEAELAKIGK
jgi:hypothetical protein